MGGRVIRRGHQEGQSTFEYVLVLAAVIAVIIWAAVNFIAGSAGTSGSGGVKSVMHDSQEVMTKASSRLATDLGLSGTGGGGGGNAGNSGN